MQKVDRLGWTAGFSLKCYGVRIGFRSNDPIWLDRVSRHLPQDWETLSSPVVDHLFSILIGEAGPRPDLGPFNLLYGNSIPLVRTVDVEEVFDTLESSVRLLVAELAHHRVFVHAGVVGWRGQAIVIPGRSFSGKSTMVAELVRAGATYYSDEFAVFDSGGWVHPFPKPLEIRDSGSTKQRKFAVEELGGQTGNMPLPVGLILMTDFKKGTKWRPRCLSPGRGILSLLANTVSARRRPEKALGTLQQVVAGARILKGARGEAQEIVQLVLDRASEKMIPVNDD